MINGCVSIVAGRAIILRSAHLVSRKNNLVSRKNKRPRPDLSGGRKTTFKKPSLEDSPYDFLR
jgi:hypothetical protein